MKKVKNTKRKLIIGAAVFLGSFVLLNVLAYSIQKQMHSSFENNEKDLNKNVDDYLEETHKLKDLHFEEKVLSLRNEKQTKVKLQVFSLSNKSTLNLPFRFEDKEVFEKVKIKSISKTVAFWKYDKELHRYAFSSPTKSFTLEDIPTLCNTLEYESSLTFENNNCLYHLKLLLNAYNEKLIKDFFSEKDIKSEEEKQVFYSLLPIAFTFNLDLENHSHLVANAKDKTIYNRHLYASTNSYSLYQSQLEKIFKEENRHFTDNHNENREFKIQSDMSYEELKASLEKDKNVNIWNGENSLEDKFKAFKQAILDYNFNDFNYASYIENENLSNDLKLKETNYDKNIKIATEWLKEYKNKNELEAYSTYQRHNDIFFSPSYWTKNSEFSGNFTGSSSYYYNKFDYTRFYSNKFWNNIINKLIDTDNNKTSLNDYFDILPERGGRYVEGANIIHFTNSYGGYQTPGYGTNLNVLIGLISNLVKNTNNLTTNDYKTLQFQIFQLLLMTRNAYEEHMTKMGLEFKNVNSLYENENVEPYTYKTYEEEISNLSAFREKPLFDKKEFSDYMNALLPKLLPIYTYSQIHSFELSQIQETLTNILMSSFQKQLLNDLMLHTFQEDKSNDFETHIKQLKEKVDKDFPDSKWEQDNTMYTELLKYLYDKKTYENLLTSSHFTYINFVEVQQVLTKQLNLFISKWLEKNQDFNEKVIQEHLTNLNKRDKNVNKLEWENKDLLFSYDENGSTNYIIKKGLKTDLKSAKLPDFLNYQSEIWENEYQIDNDYELKQVNFEALDELMQKDEHKNAFLLSHNKEVLAKLFKLLNRGLISEEDKEYASSPNFYEWLYNQVFRYVNKSRNALYNGKDLLNLIQKYVLIPMNEYFIKNPYGLFDKTLTFENNKSEEINPLTNKDYYKYIFANSNKTEIEYSSNLWNNFKLLYKREDFYYYYIDPERFKTLYNDDTILSTNEQSYTKKITSEKLNEEINFNKEGFINYKEFKGYTPLIDFSESDIKSYTFKDYVINSLNQGQPFIYNFFNQEENKKKSWDKAHKPQYETKNNEQFLLVDKGLPLNALNLNLPLAYRLNRNFVASSSHYLYGVFGDETKNILHTNAYFKNLFKTFKLDFMNENNLSFINNNLLNSMLEEVFSNDEKDKSFQKVIEYHNIRNKDDLSNLESYLTLGNILDRDNINGLKYFERNTLVPTVIWNNSDKTDKLFHSPQLLYHLIDYKATNISSQAWNYFRVVLSLLTKEDFSKHNTYVRDLSAELFSDELGIDKQRMLHIEQDFDFKALNDLDRYKYLYHKNIWNSKENITKNKKLENNKKSLRYKE